MLNTYSALLSTEEVGYRKRNNSANLSILERFFLFKELTVRLVKNCRPLKEILLFIGYEYAMVF